MSNKAPFHKATVKKERKKEKDNQNATSPNYKWFHVVSSLLSKPYRSVFNEVNPKSEESKLITERKDWEHVGSHNTDAVKLE